MALDLCEDRAQPVEFLPILAGSRRQAQKSVGRYRQIRCERLWPGQLLLQVADHALNTHDRHRDFAVLQVALVIQLNDVAVVLEVELD